MSTFCGSCGAQRQTPDQAFCQACGTPLTSAAPVPAQVPAQVPAPVPAHPTMHPTMHPAADYAVPAALPPRPRGRLHLGRVVGIGVVALALVGGGFVGWQFLGPKGGADSPEQAVRQFVDSAVSQDVLGVLDMVNPGEVEGLDDLVSAARDRLADEDITTKSGDLTDALTVSVDHLDLKIDELGDFAARVELQSGSYRVEYDPSEVPDRLEFVSDEYPDSKTWSGDLVEDLGYSLPDANYQNDEPDPYLMTSKIDGRWYVTALGTYLDWFLGVYDDSEFDDAGIRPPDYDAIGEDVEPVVGKDPEDVLDNLADAASSGDIEHMLANFPGDEVVALRPYARTYEDIFADDGSTYDVSIDDVDTDVEDLGGDLTKLTVRNGIAYGTYSDNDGYEESGSASIDGRCVSAAEDGYDQDSFCIEGDVVEKSGIDSFFLVLRKVDGGYQVDPIATAVEYARTVIESAPSSLVDDAIDELRDNT
jgi:hypothetical protein